MMESCGSVEGPTVLQFTRTGVNLSDQLALENNEANAEVP